MPELTANFETGVNGATIATSDTGSSTAFDAVSVGTGATAAYDNTIGMGSLCSKFVTTGTSSASYIEWSTAWGTQTDHYSRLFMYPTGTTSFTFLQFVNTGVSAARLRYKTSTGQIEVLDNTAAVVGTTTTSLKLNAWNRIECRVVHSATVGSVEVKVFTNPAATTPDETLTLTGLNTAANSTSVRIGFPIAASNLPATYFDDIIVGASSYPGPVAQKTAWLIA